MMQNRFENAEQFDLDVNDLIPNPYYVNDIQEYKNIKTGYTTDRLFVGKLFDGKFFGWSVSTQPGEYNIVIIAGKKKDVMEYWRIKEAGE